MTNFEPLGTDNLTEKDRKLQSIERYGSTLDKRSQFSDLDVKPEEEDRDVLGNIIDLPETAVRSLGRGVMGAANLALDVLTIPDEVGHIAIEGFRQGREALGLGQTVPSSSEAIEMRKKTQANIEDIKNIRSLDDLSQTLVNMIDRGQDRPWDEQIMGALATLGATAVGKQVLKSLGMVGNSTRLKEFIKTIEPLDTTPVVRAADDPGALAAAAKDTVTENVPAGTQSIVTGKTVVTEVKPSSLMDNLYGIPPIRAGLTKAEEAENAVLGIFGRLDNNPIGNAPFQIRKQVQPAIDNTASALGVKFDAVLKKAFVIDKSGRVQGLKGIDPTLPGEPTIADIAARLPLYIDSLSPLQRKAMQELQDALAPYRQLLEEVGLIDQVRERSDILQGGFYIPRGRALEEGADAPRFFGKRSGISHGVADHSAVFTSQAEGIENGWAYSPISEVLTSHIRSIGNAAVDIHISTYFKQLVDPVTQELLGQSAKVRLLKNNPHLVAKHDSLRRDVSHLTSLINNLDDGVRKILDDFLNPSIPFDDIEAFRNAIRDGFVIKSGIRQGATREELINVRNNALDKLKEMAPEWKAAVEKSRIRIPTGQNIIGPGGIEISGLQGLTFPDHIANSANRILEGDPNWLKSTHNILDPLNHIYRAFRATLDVSAMGIQGLLGLHSAPQSYNAALRVMFRAIGDEQVLGQFMVNFDETAAHSNRLSSHLWGRAGLRLGGGNTEFALGKDLPVFTQTNRAYGYFGDTLRLGWADELLQQELRKVSKKTGKTRTLQEIIDSGDIEKISNIANNMTGWSKGRAFGSLGDLVLFAPRFLNSRLTTLTKAMSDGGIEGKAARRSFLRMMGNTVIATVALNEVLGEETDFRPMVNGKVNSNFMRVRAFGRDYSLFGTWDSIARAIIVTAGGNPQDALRGMSSGVVANAWNFMSGRTFLGEEVPRPTKLHFWDDEDFDPAEFAKFIFLENFVPFAAEEAGESVQQVYSGITQSEISDVVSGMASIAGEMTGIKSSKITKSEDRDIARKQEMLERVTAGLPEDMLESDREAMIAGDFDSLSSDIQSDIDATPRVAEKTGLLMDSRRNQGSEWQRYLDERTKFESWYKKGKVTESGVEPGVDDLVDLFARSMGGLLEEGENPISGAKFREQLTLLNRDLHRRKLDLRESDEGKKALEFIEEHDPPTNEFNIALDEYYQRIYDPYLEDHVSGNYDFDERERRLQVMREKYGNNIMDRIDQFLDKNDHPVVKQLRRDQEMMAPYFRLFKDRLEHFEKNAVGFAGLLDLYDEYRLIPTQYQPIELKNNKKFNRLRVSINKMDERMEVPGFDGAHSYRQRWLMCFEKPEESPTCEDRKEIDRLLVYWGYRLTPANASVKLELIKLNEQRQPGLRDLNIQPRDFTPEEREEIQGLVQESEVLTEVLK